MADENPSKNVSDFDISFHHPESIISDERFDVTIDGLPNGKHVTVSASMDDKDGKTWESRVDFEVEGGSLELDGADPIGELSARSSTIAFLQSMEPIDDQTNPYFGPNETTIRFEVSAGDTILGTSEITRYFADPDIESVNTPDHLAGTLYEPPGDGRALGVVLLHGGDGRPLERKARLLASNGFVALALKYFNFIGQDNPVVMNGLVDIPVEYVDEAIDWLLEHDRVTGSSVGVYGRSKGGELGLLAASRNDNIGGVVSVNGSALVWEGFVYREDHPGATWTIDEKEVSYVPWTDDLPWEEMDKPYELRSLYRDSYESATDEQIEEATIPVHRIDGPVLFVTGGDDQMWNTARFNRHAIDLLEEHGNEYEHVFVEDAGHTILPPFKPTVNREEGYWVFGGTPEEYKIADRMHWSQTLQIFDRL